MGLGSAWQQSTPVDTCGHSGTAFYMVIDYILDGYIHQERGRYCQLCGVEFAISVPPEAGDITVHIIDWRSPGLVVVLRPPEAEAEQAKEGAKVA